MGTNYNIAQGFLPSSFIEESARANNLSEKEELDETFIEIQKNIDNNVPFSLEDANAENLNESEGDPLAEEIALAINEGTYLPDLAEKFINAYDHYAFLTFIDGGYKKGLSEECNKPVEESNTEKLTVELDYADDDSLNELLYYVHHSKEGESFEDFEKRVWDKSITDYAKEFGVDHKVISYDGPAGRWPTVAFTGTEKQITNLLKKYTGDDEIETKYFLEGATVEESVKTESVELIDDEEDEGENLELSEADRIKQLRTRIESMDEDDEIEIEIEEEVQEEGNDTDTDHVFKNTIKDFSEKQLNDLVSGDGEIEKEGGDRWEVYIAGEYLADYNPKKKELYTNATELDIIPKDEVEEEVQKKSRYSLIQEDLDESDEGTDSVEFEANIDETDFHEEPTGGATSEDFEDDTEEDIDVTVQNLFDGFKHAAKNDPAFTFITEINDGTLTEWATETLGSDELKNAAAKSFGLPVETCTEFLGDVIKHSETLAELFDEKGEEVTQYLGDSDSKTEDEDEAEDDEFEEPTDEDGDFEDDEDEF